MKSESHGGARVGGPLQSGASKAVFDFDAIGPLSAALTLLEHPDLAVLEKDDLPFEQASGQVRLDLGMDFPLKDELADTPMKSKSYSEAQTVSVTPPQWVSPAVAELIGHPPVVEFLTEFSRFGAKRVIGQGLDLSLERIHFCDLGV